MNNDMKKMHTKLQLIETHERFYTQIKAQVSNKEITEEQASLELNNYRQQLLAALESDLNLDEETDEQRAYENILFNVLKDEVRRSFGYGKAMQRHKEEVENFNRTVGDRVLDFAIEDTERILNGLAKINFIRRIGTNNGLYHKEDIELIVNKMIDRLFGAKQ